MWKFCEIKVDVVVWDECEENVRVLLNFGYMFGYVLEVIMGYIFELLYGEVVLIGMVFVVGFFEFLGLCSCEDREWIEVYFEVC